MAQQVCTLGALTTMSMGSTSWDPALCLGCPAAPTRYPHSTHLFYNHCLSHTLHPKQPPARGPWLTLHQIQRTRAPYQETPAPMPLGCSHLSRHPLAPAPVTVSEATSLS